MNGMLRVRVTLALVQFHDQLGHLWYDSVKELVERSYYCISDDFKSYIGTCDKCHLAIGPLPKQASLNPRPSEGHPFERWGLDFIQNLPFTTKKNRHIFTCIDYARRWVVANAVPEMDSDFVIRFLYDRIFILLRYVLY